MEELRSYCQIPNNIDFELSDGGGGGGFSGLVGSCAFSPFYQFGIMAWNRFPFPSFSFCCCLLAVWREVKKRLPLVRLGVEEGLVGIRLLQAASSPLCPWRS